MGAGGRTLGCYGMAGKPLTRVFCEVDPSFYAASGWKNAGIYWPVRRCAGRHAQYPRRRARPGSQPVHWERLPRLTVPARRYWSVREDALDTWPDAAFHRRKVVLRPHLAIRISISFLHRTLARAE